MEAAAGSVPLCCAVYRRSLCNAAELVVVRSQARPQFFSLSCFRFNPVPTAAGYPPSVVAPAELGGLAPNFSILGHQAPPPPGGAGALFWGFRLCRALRPVCIFHTFFTFFFILCQSSEPFVAHCHQNWLLVELVVVLDRDFKVLGSKPSGGKFLLVSFALLFHRFSSACM